MPDSAIPADWMAKAQADLRSARVLRSASPPLLEQAIYLAAQAAEKMLKALLIKYGVPYRSFRHDVPAVLTEACAIEPSLSAFDLRLANFNAYNVETRYPISSPLTITEAEVDEAISTVQDLNAAISALL
ncbi:MAG: HEPN domain-containing protein [Acidobacteria bacterium]|nr:HEPN domain-containing protein [Acidobacteriota bacterium]